VSLDRPTLVKELVEETGYDRRVILTILNTITEKMRQAIIDGRKVDLYGLGIVKFTVLDTATGIRRTVKFKPHDVFQRKMTSETTPLYLKRRRVYRFRTMTGDIGSG
jgi:nucleoid DNA-binding protein